MFYARDHQFHDFSGDDAYRAFLISRNEAPLIHHSGDRHWKRLLVAARHAIKHVRGFFAALRMALVADKMRRARDVPALHGIRHGHDARRRP